MTALERAVQQIEEITQMAVNGNKQLKVWDDLLTRSQKAAKLAETTEAKEHAGVEAQSRQGDLG